MQCAGCKEEKPEGEFSWRYKSQGIRQSYCRACKRLSNQRWYQRHKEEQKERVARNTERYEGTARAFITAAKDVPCTDCGGIFPPEAMDFDHVVDGKIANVSRLARSSNIRKVQEEIAKCEVVCACCHRIRTRLRLMEKALAS